MPSWQDFQPFIVSGLALGGVYALSGVGLIVLYRATGVLNLAFGALGAMGALIAWSLIKAGVPGWLSWLACVVFAAAVTLGYGILFGPALAKTGSAGQGGGHHRADPHLVRPGGPALDDQRRAGPLDHVARPTTAASWSARSR